MTTRVIQLIYTEERRGRGTEEDPIRIAPTLYTFDGELVGRRRISNPAVA